MITKKKRLISALLALSVACSGLGGCSKDSKKSYFDMTYDELSKYVTLGEYKNLEVTLDYYAVEESEIQDVIESDFASYIEEINITQREIREGDIVIIDFVGTIDGEEYEGNSAEDFEVRIGDGTFVDAEEALLGAYLGDTVTFEGSFKEGSEVDESLIGKTAVFEATVKEITAVSLPRMTDDLVYEATGYTSYDEYIEGLRTEMRTYYDDLAMSNAQTLLWVEVCTNSTLIEYPKDKFADAKQDYYDYYEEIAADYDMTVDDMLINYLGISKDTYEEKANEHAANVVYEDLVLFSIAKKENITISDEEYDKRAQEYVDDLIRESLSESDESDDYTDMYQNATMLNGQSSSSEEEKEVITSVTQLEAIYGKDYVRQVVLYEMVLEYIFENANVTYSDYFPEENK
ncbi:MAG: hypothetical protein IJO29_02025 [Oscillospiraceae bacterium]|nr:hypothetical protein [Oscillospiraceae bacterium]